MSAIPSDFLMYNIYLDDSGTNDPKQPFQLVTAVIVKDKRFFSLEHYLAALTREWIGSGIDTFEFKACDLWHGDGIFSAMPKQDCRDLLLKGLSCIDVLKLPIVCGVVDKKKLDSRIETALADPVEVAFSSCGFGVNEWFDSREYDENGVFICDDTQNRKVKEAFKRAFRKWRRKAYFDEENCGRQFSYVLDDMYFGDSAESCGVQIADMCGFAISRHLRGFEDSEYLYAKIKPHLFKCEILPVPTVP